MSKRPSTTDNPINSPFVKKPRIDIDDTVAELHVMSAQLLDALKAQKAAIQWGHTTCRDDTLASITKTELLISSIGELRKKSKDACSAVDKLIDALVKSEINALTKTVAKYSRVEEGFDELPALKFLGGVQEYQLEITREVKMQLKEKLRDMTVDEIIKKVQAETKGVFKAVAKKQLSNILDDVLD